LSTIPELAAELKVTVLLVVRTVMGVLDPWMNVSLLGHRA
jgi:hypothetical protein